MINSDKANAQLKPNNADIETYKLKGTVETGKIRREYELSPKAKAGLEAVIDLKQATQIVKIKEKNSAGLVVGSREELFGKHDIRLIHVKGQRRMQYRLVKPELSLLNNNDCYVLITPSASIVWTGRNSSIMKKAKAVELATSIQKAKEYNCECNDVRIVNDVGKVPSSFLTRFLKSDQNYLTEECTFWEDLEFEETINLIDYIYVFDISTEKDNKKGQFILDASFRNQKLKKSMLDSTKAYTLDFGSEVYLWIGSKFPILHRQSVRDSAMDIFNNTNLIEIKDERIDVEKILKYGYFIPNQSVPRPSWVTFERITENSESLLFIKKFQHWTTLSSNKQQKAKHLDSVSINKECDIDINKCYEDTVEYDYIIERMVINRGKGGKDTENEFLYSISTIAVSVYQLIDVKFELLDDKAKNMFFSAEAYLVEWKFFYRRSDVQTLKGDVSMFDDNGKEALLYFYWQGNDCSISEKGFSAILTTFKVGRKAHHIRVSQNDELPAFLSIFNGRLIINKGKSGEFKKDNEKHLYIARGKNMNSETYFIQVPLSHKSLRLQGRFLLIDLDENVILFWPKVQWDQTNVCTEDIRENFCILFNKNLNLILNHNEQDGIAAFSKALNFDLNQNNSLTNDKIIFCCHFKMDNWNKINCFRIISPLNCVINYDNTPIYCDNFSVSQHQIYNIIQPALVLICTEYCTYLWHGWKSANNIDNDFEQESTSYSNILKDHTFLKLRTDVTKSLLPFLKDHNFSTQIYIIHATLEPKSFKQLFPTWRTYKEIKVFQKAIIKDFQNYEIISSSNVDEKKLYHLKDLQVRPLPEGVNPLEIEMHLYDEEFETVFNLSKEGFKEIPQWKQIQLRKLKNLF